MFKKILAVFMTALIAFGALGITASAAAKKLSKPTLSVSSYTTTTVTLKWKSVKNAQKYQIYYKSEKWNEQKRAWEFESSYKKYGTTKNTSITVKHLWGGFSYKFKVRAIATSDGKTVKSDFSSVKTVTTKFEEGAKAKPVIYLYPGEQTDVSVSVDLPAGGELTCTYPEYNGGWSVTAMPDGTLYDANGNEYYCLYWEGRSADTLDCSKGWCVAGNDTAAFLREKLLYIGLSEREANEFIIYWLPLMQNNPYNIISFHTDEYSAEVPLTVSPAPDSVIRVFMTFEARDEAAEVEPQVLPQYERNGFTLVEWGGRNS